jgi:hypothetical protein
LIPPDPSIITWLEEWTPEEKLKKEFKEFKEEEPGARRRWVERAPFMRVISRSVISTELPRQNCLLSN